MQSQKRSPFHFLVRHGESTLNAAGVKFGLLDPPLTPRGVAQARTAARSLQDGPRVIYTSPLKRAHHFALLLASELDIATVTVVEALRERSFGAAEGMTPEMIAADFPRGVPLLETYSSAALRARAFLDALDAPAIIVTHQGVIKGITGTRVDNGEVVTWSRSQSASSRTQAVTTERTS